MNPRAKSAKPTDDYILEIEFINGETRRFDMKPLFQYPVYQPLKDPSYFNRVFVSGGIVQWPNEEDISPDLLYLDSPAVA